MMAVIAVAKAFEETAKMFQTPMGQKVLERWLNDSEKFTRWVEATIERIKK